MHCDRNFRLTHLYSGEDPQIPIIHNSETFETIDSVLGTTANSFDSRKTWVFWDILYTRQIAKGGKGERDVPV